MIHTKEHQALIIKQLQGKTNKEEDVFLNNWKSKSDQNREEYENISNIWNKTEELEIPTQNNPDFIWANINKEINRKYTPKIPVFDSTVFFKAAAFVLLAITGVLLYNNAKKEYKVIPSQETITSIPEKPLPHNTLITHYGQRSTCVLPDSTVVHLNSESSLAYPIVFNGDSREVILNGEAYFSVRPDKHRPFIVNSGNSKITVTGTEFNVRSRNKKVDVVVTKGSVNVMSVSSKKNENLKRGEMAVLDNNGIISDPVHVNLKYHLAWRENKLAFKHTALSEVMSEIRRTFNVEVQFVNNSAKTRTITGIFETDSLEKIISVLSVTLDLDISQKGTKIIIK